VFSVSLDIADGKDFAAGVLKLRDNKAILKSVVGHAAAWMTSLSADIIDVSKRNAVFFMCVVPAGLPAPTSHDKFLALPGRAITSTSETVSHAQLHPSLPKVLSYKVAGCSVEEAPQAVLVIGLLLSEKVAKGGSEKKETWHFGVRCRLRVGQKGFVEGEDQTLSSS